MYQSQAITGNNGAGNSNGKDDGDNETGCDTKSKPSPAQYFRFMIDLYVLSDKLMDPITANLVIDDITCSAEAGEIWPNRDNVKILYKSTVPWKPVAYTS